MISTRPLPKSSTNCQVSDPRVPRRSFLIARTTERMISLIAKSFHRTSTTKLKTRSLHDKQLRRGLQLLLVPQLPQPRPSDGGTPPRSSKERSTTSPRVTRARRKTVALRRRNANSQYVTTESPSLDFAVIIPNFTTRPAAIHLRIAAAKEAIDDAECALRANGADPGHARVGQHSLRKHTFCRRDCGPLECHLLTVALP